MKCKVIFQYILEDQISTPITLKCYHFWVCFVFFADRVSLWLETSCMNYNDLKLRDQPASEKFFVFFYLDFFNFSTAVLFLSQYLHITYHLFVIAPWSIQT